MIKIIDQIKHSFKISLIMINHHSNYVQNIPCFSVYCCENGGITDRRQLHTFNIDMYLTKKEVCQNGVSISHPVVVL